MKRVLVFNHFAVPRGQAGGTRHAELFATLDGWEATIIASDRHIFTGAQSTTTDAGFRHVWTSPTTTSPISRVLNWVSYAFTSLWAGLRAGPIDVAYGSSPHMLAPLSAWLVAKARRARFVLEVRDLWPRVLLEMGGMRETSLLYRSLTALERMLYRKAELIVVMAEGVQKTLVDEGVDAGKIAFIPNAADPEDFDPPADKETLRRRYGFEGVTAVYAGAHGVANGLDLLLDAAKSLQVSHRELRVVLVGDGAVKAQLQARVATEAIDTVSFLDPVPKSEMPSILGAADIGLHVLADIDLFRYGVSPNKLFDYMAAGLPVITNTAGEVASFVEAARAGVAVAAGELAIGLAAVVNAGEDGRRAWGSSGRAYMEAHRSRRAMRERLLLSLNRLAETRLGD